MTHHSTVVSGRAHVARASGRPFRLHPLSLAIAALLASPAGAQVPASFIAQKITGPAGGVVTSFGVTDSSVVGAMQFSQGPIVAWQNRTIDTLVAGTGRGINGDRDIVGSTSIQTANGQASVAMRWTPGLNGVTVLSPVHSNGQQTTGIAQAINDAGWIVGQNSLPGEGTGAHPVMWSPQGAMTTLGERWDPVALNESRHVVGTSFEAGVNSAVLWRPGVGLTTLPLASIAGTGSRALDINESGVIAGYGFGQDGQGNSVFTPVVWTANTAQPLSIGGPFTRGATASAINDEGWVVGTGRIPVTGFGPTFTGRTAPILWAGAGSGPVDLSSITFMDLGNGQRGLMNSQPDLFFMEAVDINNRGQILVNTIRLADNPNPLSGGRFEPYILGRAESFLLSECIRCGQIKPNPNPSGELLDVGPDWIDAFNREAFVNNGELRLATELRNLEPGKFDNFGVLDIQDRGTFDSEARLENHRGARIRVNGNLELKSAKGAVNQGDIVVEALGDLRVAGVGLLNDGAATFRQRGGVVWVESELLFENASLSQEEAGIASVLRGGSLGLLSSGAILNGTTSNYGLFVLAIAQESVSPARVTVGGHFDNRSEGTVSIQDSQWIVGGTLRSQGVITLRGTSELWVGGNDANATFLSGGRLEVGASALGGARMGGRFESYGDTLNQGGLGVFSGSQLVAGGVFNNANGILVDGAGALLFVPASAVAGDRLRNDGTIALATGGKIEVGGRFENYGTVNAASGTVVSNYGNVGVFFGAAITGQGTYEQHSGNTGVFGELRADHISILGGSLTGTGRISSPNIVLIGLGVSVSPTLVLPGNSPGTMTFDADVSLDNALLEIEIDDYQHYDRLVIDGNLTVNQARMQVFLAEGYAPDLNDRFDWLSTSGTVTGRENLQIELPNNVPAGWTTQIGADGNLTVWNDSAVDLFDPFFTTYVPEGMLAFIDLSRQGLTEYSATERFVIEGQLSLFSGSTLRPDHGVEIASTGRMTSRGTIVVDANGGVGGFVNEGRFENRVGGVFLNDLAGRQLVNRARFDNYGQFENRATVQNDAGATFQQGGEFVNAPGAKIENEGRFVVSGRVTNDQAEINNAGRFEITDTGRVEGQGTYSQQSGTASTVVDGRLEAGDLFLYAGRLSGHGTVASPRAFLGDFGAEEPLVVLPGGEFSVGTLTLEGQASAASTRFVIDIAGAEDFDQFGIQGSIFFHAGEVAFVLLDGYVPTVGQRFDWLKLANFSSFYTNEDVLDWTVSLRRADGSLWELGGSSGFAAGAPVHFTFDGTSLVAAPVPEPGTWALMLGGLAFVAGTAMRRRSA